MCDWHTPTRKNILATGRSVAHGTDSPGNVFKVASQWLHVVPGAIDDRLVNHTQQIMHQ